MNLPAEIYKDIYSNYKNCDIDNEYLSDTWAHTLREKGHKFILGELLEMRAPGNRVNSWMVDSLFSIDDTAIDLNNPTVATLIQIGESDFGHPRKDICVKGQYFSSLFLRDVNNAAFLIRLIEQAGFKRPRVLEIGGGTGLLMYILKIYFKGEITLFAVDIPETLLIQEWYLRNCFPDTPHCYKATSEPVNFNNSGINFINAYVLKHQNVQFDIAINFDSMQEMNKSAVDAYINYIELNISPKGLFLFQNRFGHSTNCVPEPSEYNFDTNWKIEVAEIMNPFNNCNEVEQLRLVLRRTTESEDTDTRRLVLRTIWNGFISGLFQNGDPIIEQLISLPKQYSPINALSRIRHIFEKNNISPDFISSLKSSLYFPPSFYISDTLLKIFSKSENINYTPTPKEVILLAEMQYCKELIAAGNNVNITAIQRQLNKICLSCSQFVHKPIPSDFWNSNLAGILFSLGDNQNGTVLLKNSLCRSTHPRWVLRSAILFHRYNLIQEANIALEYLRQTESTNDPIIKLKQIEIEYLAGNADYARCKLEALLSKRNAEHIPATEIAKTAARIEAMNILRMILLSDKEMFTISNGKAFFTLLSNMNLKLISQSLAEFIETYFEDNFKGNDSYTVRINHGILMLYLGMETLGLSNIEKEINSNSYFDLARCACVFLKFGYNELADGYFQKSIRLRPGNFMHQEYIGNAYFSCGCYDIAVTYFQQALANKPYLRHIKAHVAYCNLPKEIKHANIFGNFSDLQRYFTLSQSFYEDSPNWK
jgi:putative sugar O-methyltransferase